MRNGQEYHEGNLKPSEGHTGAHRGILEQRERTDGAQSAIMEFRSGRPC